MSFRSVARFLLVSGGILLLLTLILALARRAEARNHLVVFRSDGNFRSGYYQMAADGSTEKRLDDIPRSALRMEISPDGRWIAYLASVNFRTSIFRVRLDGSDKQRLTGDNIRVLEMEWSPDARQIIYKGFEYPDLQTFIMNADGSNVREITVLPDDASEIRWSPDGEWLLYVDAAGLFRSRVDGSEVLAVVQNPAVKSGDWSPDGQSIVFASLQDSPLEQLYRVSLEDGSVERLTDDRGGYARIMYSSDGEWITFQRFATYWNSIFRIRADGSDTQALPGFEANNSFPQWFPIIDLVLREWLLITVGMVMSV
ncbi:MAG TPA: DUF5050 domain-containing protein, partial [Aggregatilineales bacterium]|nr:DUF5050 domain-containing protein [Aggregatilineales bacterium]